MEENDYTHIINEFFNDIPNDDRDDIDMDISEEEYDEIDEPEEEPVQEPEPPGDAKINPDIPPSRRRKNRINTTKVFDNTGFFNGGLMDDIPDNTPIRLSPVISDQYDYSTSEDIVLLQERKENAQLIYDIYNSAPFAKMFTNPATGEIKIPKSDTHRVFYYIKNKLLKRKKISAFECVIAICEYFDFSYEFVVNKVLSSKMMSDILDDYYNNMGMKRRIDEQTTAPLF